ncbi:iron-siderophore ABC transporter substrate-binding protein [Falsirhodobacter algicola]|uniref:ABC transporter substrate-binding protein n=1 Tax=Falsirhodobacter algicola TaxID=2692330 RepID=A0A8J8SLG3_9RHOB|nr:iron-siderophore ABC transporter substrate-binding protein [Falsirhodobacter algicola]QUS37045.1 ABC transporter substrate-binding protein [Falsirhodobacter algicola]
MIGRRGFLAGAASALAAPAVLAQGGALRFTGPYGDTVLKEPGRRVVSAGFNTQDPLLALGVVPVGIRDWFGDQPYGVWPWAQPLLGDATPEVMRGEVSVEAIAGLAPDLIIASGSGLSQAEFALLSRVAPVVMQEPQYSTYGMPWDAETRMIGRAVGREDAAEAAVSALQDRFAAIRDRHPDWAGRTAVMAWQDGGQTGAYLGNDVRAQFLAELGFQPTPALRAREGGDFYTTLSPEDLSPLDADLIVWISSAWRAGDVAGLAMRQTLKAVQEGREIFADDLRAGALSFGSVLSMPYALDWIEGEIVLALDGRPETVVPSAQKAGLVP